MTSAATTTINGQDIPPDLAPFYEQANRDPQVRMAIAYYYREDPNPTSDGAAAVAHAVRLRIAQDRYDTDQRVKPTLDAIRSASLCAARCGGIRDLRARNGLCARCG